MTTQSQNHNSAIRLLSLLNSIPKIYSYKFPASSNDPNAPTPLGHGVLKIQPLQEAFGFVLPENPTAEPKVVHQFYHDLKLVYLEFCQDMDELTISSDQKNSLLHELAGIEEVIYPRSLEEPRQPTQSELNSLNICSTFIKRESEITKDELESIRKAIVALRTLIEKSDVSSALKKALLDLIRHFENAISSYKIHGAKGLRRTLKSMVADLKEIYDNDGFKEELKGSVFLNDLLSLFRITDTIASKYLEYKPYIDGAFRILLGAPPT